MRLDDLGARDIQTLYTNLKAIQDRAIPWKRCIDFALAALFTVLFMAFLINILSGQYNLGSIPWFAGPCVSQGGRSALENFHYYTFGNIEAYTNKACDLLKNSLLLEPAKILGRDFELITQKTIDGKKQTVWDRVQCVFRAKQGTKKTRRETNTTISEVAKLLEASNIQYILISVRQYRTALYINAASAYQALTNWRWSASSNVATIAQKLEMALTRLALITDLKTKMFAILHKRNIIAGCWLDDKPGSIDYEILPGQEWNTFKCVEFVLLMKKNRFSCPINRITVENLIRAVQTTLGLAAQPATGGPMLTEPGTAARRKYVKASQPTATEPVAPAPAVLAEAHRWALPGNRNVTSNDDNIAMIWDTRNYEHPIFVMNDLAVESFNSPFTYDAACTQLENPRYAARRGQQGLFITENKQTITLKLLGQMDARGNVRCSNELPPIVSTLGSSLYIINTVDNNAHH